MSSENKTAPTLRGAALRVVEVFEQYKNCADPLVYIAAAIGVLARAVISPPPPLSDNKELREAGKLVTENWKSGMAFNWALVPDILRPPGIDFTAIPPAPKGAPAAPVGLVEAAKRVLRRWLDAPDDGIVSYGRDMLALQQAIAEATPEKAGEGQAISDLPEFAKTHDALFSAIEAGLSAVDNDEAGIQTLAAGAAGEIMRCFPNLSLRNPLPTGGPSGGPWPGSAAHNQAGQPLPDYSSPPPEAPQSDKGESDGK